MSEHRFEIRFLEAMQALRDLDKALIRIGMSGCREIENIRRAVVAHGAETADDIFNNH